MNYHRLMILLGLASSVGLTNQAQAAIGAELLPLAAVSATLTAGDPCRLAPTPGAAAAKPYNKISALTGGQVSQLELIADRQRQGGGSQLATSASSLPAGAPALRCSNTPAISGIAPPPRTRIYGRAKLDAGDFLQSKRLPVSRTHFDSDWDRVRGNPLSRQVAGRFSGSDAALLSSVNRWTNTNVLYAEDRDLYGKADYWADAAETLQRRAGDCEDIAIVKMQLLAAAGVPRSSMYLTIARDLARNTDHAVLIVKQGDRHWLLDNATNAVLDTRDGLDYRPIMSFSGDNKWLHGY